MRKFPRIGDRVIAPFGPEDEVEGEVINISHTFDPPAVTIEFTFKYTDELHTMVYSADQLRPAEVATR